MKRPPAALAAAGLFVTLVSVVRVASNFLETVSVVAEERRSDLELIELCKSGAARGSAKMNSACLQAQRDRASPLLLKATARALSNSWSEFCDAVSSPFGLFSALLFLLASSAGPLLPMARALLRSWEPQDPEGDGEARHVIVLAGDEPRRGLRRKLRALLARGGGVSQSEASLSEWGCEEGRFKED